MTRWLTLFLFTTGYLAGPLAAQSRAIPLTRRIAYHNPSWSPDGRTILFESTLDGPYSVYTIGADGMGLRRLTVDGSNNQQPAWSPDGRRIVFSSDRAGHLDIYLMNADGSGLTRLTSTAGGLYYRSAFSPDGRFIVFQGRPDRREVPDRIYLVGSDGAGLRQLTDSSYGAEGPRWSPDGRTITFRQVLYPRRYWSEMGPRDLEVAQAGAHRMSISPDGTRLTPAEPAPAPAQPAGVPLDAQLSPTGGLLVYANTVGGWSGVYVYDTAARSERLITGGPGAGPVGYLRTAGLTAFSDTLDTWESPRPRGGPLRRGSGAWVLRSLRRIGARRWELTDTWHDSTGRVTARQLTRTQDGSLASELESVRALEDSATLLVSGNQVTAWVVPRGQPARLFEGALGEERYAGVIVQAAIALARPAVGQVFLRPVASLYGANPLESSTDSVRVLRRDTLYTGSTPLPVVVLEGSNGQVWADESTGAAVLTRGNAGPNRWWWHIRRGVRPPPQ